MEMNELLELPAIRDLIEQRNQAEIEAAAQARAEALQVIEALQRQRDGTGAAIVKARQKLEAAYQVYENAKLDLNQLEAAMATVKSKLHRAQRDLRTAHGEAYALDAVTELRCRLQGLQQRRERIAWKAEYIDEPARGYRIMKRDPAALAECNQIDESTAIVKEAMRQAEGLLNAKLAPAELKAQAQAILAMAPDIDNQGAAT